MSYSRNALNHEKIKTKMDITEVRNSYKKQLEEQIQVNKTTRDVNALFNFNGQLSHFTLSLKSLNEILTDKKRLGLDFTVKKK